MQNVAAIPILKNMKNTEKTAKQQKYTSMTKNGFKKIWKIRPPKRNRHAKFLLPRWCHFSDSIIFVGIQWYTGHKQQVTWLE